MSSSSCLIIPHLPRHHLASCCKGALLRNIKTACNSSSGVIIRNPGDSSLPYFVCARDLMLGHPFKETIPEAQLRSQDHLLSSPSFPGAEPRTKGILCSHLKSSVFSEGKKQLAGYKPALNHHGHSLKHEFPRLHHGLEI